MIRAPSSLVVLAFASIGLGCSGDDGRSMSDADAGSGPVGDGGNEHSALDAGDAAAPVQLSDAGRSDGASGAGGGQGGSGGSGGTAGADAASAWDAGSCLIEGSHSVVPLDGGYAIVVTDPPDQPCPDAALVCVLSIGDVCFGLFSYDGAGHRVYPISAEEYEALPKHAPVSGYYGGPPSGDDACMTSGIWGTGSCPLFGYLQ